MKKLCSLGLSCQSAHQLARCAEALENSHSLTFSKGPIDWLICPPQSLACWLEAGLPDFKREELTIKNDRVYWQRFHLWFWHWFFVGPREARVIDIDATLQRELDKLAYQRAIFAKLDPSQTLFVWSNTQNNLANDVFAPDQTQDYHLTSAVRDAVQSSLNGFFKSETRILWLTRLDRCDEQFAKSPTTILLPPDETEWKGRDKVWQQAIADHIE